MEGCDGQWEHDPILIIRLFNSCCDGPSHTNPITSHNNCFLFSLIIYKGGTHGLTVFGSELKGVADLYAFVCPCLFATERTKIPLRECPNVRESRDLKIPLDVYIDEVSILCIGPCYKIDHFLDIKISYDWNGEADWTGKSFWGMGDFFNHFLSCKLQFLCIPKGSQLLFADFVVASHQCGQRAFVRFKNESFNQILG